MDKKKDNQIFIRILCVIASFVFWLYVANTENPEKDGQITVKVILENEDAITKSRLALLSGQNFEVSFRVTGPMLEINALNESKFTLKADLSSESLSKGLNRIPVYVESMPKDIYIVDKEKLKLDITLDNLIEKSVPVKYNIPVSTKAGYAAASPIITPSSVLVSGAEEYVKNVSYVQAKTELKNAEKDEELNLPVQPFDEAGRLVKNVSVNPQTVNVVIPIKKTKTVNVKVQTIGDVEHDVILESIEAIPGKIDIAGDADILKDINEIQTEPIDLSDITEDKTIEAELILNNVSTVSGVTKVSIKVSVDSIKQKNLSVNINFENLGDNLEYSSKKASVSMVLLGAGSLMQNVTEASIKCSVDLSNLGEGTHSVPVNIEAPRGVKIESYSPQSIEVTIIKKEQEPDTPTNTDTNTDTNSDNTTTE